MILVLVAGTGTSSKVRDMKKGKALEARFKKAWFGVHCPPTCHQLCLILMCIYPLQDVTGAPKRASTSLSSCHGCPAAMLGFAQSSLTHLIQIDSGDCGNGSSVSAKRPRFRRAVQRASCLLLRSAQSVKRIRARRLGICGPKPRMCWCTMPLFWVLETSSVLRTVDAADPWFLKTVIVT